MNKRHKWYNEIVAWANGAEIECQHKTFVGQDWEEVKEPMWLDDVNYRIKPQFQITVEILELLKTKMKLII